MAEVGKLENEAMKRKERLAMLRKRKDQGGNHPDKFQATEDNNDLPLPKPVFRSYKPTDEELKDGVLPQIKPADVESEVKNQLEAAKTEKLIDEVDIHNLAPRKPDWDLKRNVAQKLEKLERRTQRAIAELIRERLQAGQDDLLAAVNASAAADQLTEAR